LTRALVEKTMTARWLGVDTCSLELFWSNLMLSCRTSKLGVFTSGLWSKE